MRFLLGLLASFCFSASPAFAYGTAYQFATEYIQTLISIENIRDRAEAESSADTSSPQKLSSCVRQMESFQLELSADITQMRAARSEGKIGELQDNVIAFFDIKRDLFRQLQNNCSIMLQGPRKDVDYGAIAAETPKITARLDYIDHSIFTTAPAIFLTLVSDRLDATHHLSYLSITRAQKDELARSIVSAFGEKLHTKNPNYVVAAARVFYEGLTKKGYKGSDET